jgi:transcriptional regulator with XRE-family HTH domain
MSFMKDTTLNNPEQLGRIVRIKRQEKGLSQNALAGQLGVGRKWIIHLEAGNPKAEFGLVLKALQALDVKPTLIDQSQSSHTENHHGRDSRLHEVLLRLQRRKTK